MVFAAVYQVVPLPGSEIILGDFNVQLDFAVRSEAKQLQLLSSGSNPTQRDSKSVHPRNHLSDFISSSKQYGLIN